MAEKSTIRPYTELKSEDVAYFRAMIEKYVSISENNNKTQNITINPGYKQFGANYMTIKATEKLLILLLVLLYLLKCH